MKYPYDKHISLLRVLFLSVVLFAVTALSLFAQTNKKDSLHYPLRDNRLPYQQPSTYKGLQVPPPANLTRTLEYDPVRNEYVFKEKIGKLDFSTPYSMSQKEYQQYELQSTIRQNWNEKAKSGKKSPSPGFNPNLNIGLEAFDKIFGTNTINIVPQGSAELIFGVNTSKINNPNISERLRKTTTFDFQEKIQMNVTGTIGDKMKVEVNYNTEATFDYENKTKLEYTGKEDEIIKKVEAGNVNLPLTGSLITGSQSLFGIKTELQFGKLWVTAVVSQQKGESSVVEVKGGAQETEYEVTIDNYDSDKHFFLSQFFRDNYEAALKTLPTINSPITITKIEVWLTNKSNNFTDSRNVVAFLDLGEAKRFNTVPNFSVELQPPLNNNKYDSIPYNEISRLYNEASINARDIKTVAGYFSGVGYNFALGQDFEKIENARKLTDREFDFQPNLGYISLNFALKSDEILAVAYEFTMYGQTYRVGEFASSSGVDTKEALILKLIKGTNLTPRLPNWKLMMKNVYSINAYQINKDKFQLHVMYQDDKKGTPINYIPEEQTKENILLKVMGLDKVNSQDDPYPDGTFDFLEGKTVNASNGRIFFPTLEPFGKTLREFLQSKHVSPSVIKKYVFSELYDSTQTKARQIAEKNKFKLKGRYQSSSSSDIPLNALNVPQGSVVVTAAGRKLTENIDYTVDYTLGRVKILNQGLLESGTPIRISLESNSLFNFQTKTLVGTHLDYRFSNDFNIGATVLNLTERPLTQKVNIGDEPISNTIWGLNGTYTTKSQFLTTLVDKIPFLDTKEPSSITIDGEFAQLIPGHSKAIDKAGTAFIDDFEGSETPIDLRSFPAWSLASTPADLSLFPEASLTNDQQYGKNRAKLAWYVIDPIFTRNTSATPSNIKNNDDTRSSQFVKEVYETDIFKNVQNPTGIETNIPVLNLAFFPKERGPYNFDTTGVNANGQLTNPAKRWGGIQRELLTNDFEAANVEFIEFWLMDPFCEDTFKRNKGGSLYFDLGNVSEDVLKDSRKTFENGFPTNEIATDVDTTVWGRVPTNQSLVNAFNNDPQSRVYQDIGLDGLNDENEKVYFANFLAGLTKIPGITPEAITKATSDPSSDDFKYYRDGEYDENDVGIIGRYKKYNGMEGNSPALIDANTDYSPSSTSRPDDEDINNDNTLNENESFFQYKVDIRSNRFNVGSNFVVDSVTTKEYEFPNGTKSSVKWYQFRIPISDFQTTVGSIQDFKSIRFMRMFLTGFEDSVILRFARLELVRGEWRKYNLAFRQGGESISTPEDKDVSFEISSVNIEENSGKSPVNYVLPPGVSRQVDPQNPQLRELNEQSMVLKVIDLNNGDARAAYKGVNLDMRQYRHLKMDIHGEEMPGTVLANDELTVFIRIGSDYKNNFYEYEIPLKLTRPKSGGFNNDIEDDRYLVWPEDNRIDILLEDFQSLKQARNDELRKVNTLVSPTTVYPYTIDGRKGTYYICGNPNLSNVKTIMIGIRYPYNSTNTGHTRSAEVWVNELRLTNFNEQGGWAANLRVTTKLADFATVSVAGSTSKPGFGSIEKKVNERSKEEVYQYDVASNIELGKFFPEKSGVQIPMYVGVSETFINPQYNPLDPDVELKAALNNAKSKGERDSIKRMSQDYTIRKSLNFTNVRINKLEGKPHIYDVSNWTANYSYSETDAHNINVERSVEKRYAGGLIYSYQMRPEPIAPFQKAKIFRGDAFRLIRDFNFNLIPSSIGFRTDMSRSYNETKLRNVNYPGVVMEPTVDKDFFWNRFYDISFDLTRSIKIDFSASNVARIDEPQGIVNNDFKDEYQHWKDSVWNNIKKGGRTTHYNHDLRASYNVPINKLPFLDWTSANINYNATYDWDLAPITLEDSLNTGNTIVNSGTINTTGQLNLVTLYNKIPYFKKINQPQAKTQQKKQTKKVKFEKDKTFLQANRAKPISHKLKTEDISVKVYASDGKEIKGTMKVVNENKATFTADSSYSDVKIVVEGNVVEKPSPITIIVENATRFLLGVRNVSISWSSMKGSTMPGFMPKTKLMGMSGASNNYAPGLAFVMGIQDKNFGQKAIDNNWLTTSTILNSPYIMTWSENITLRSTIEPVRNLRIELSANRTYTRNDNSYYSPTNKAFGNNTRNGNFSMSFIAIGTAFQKMKGSSDNYSIPVYEQFKKNRFKIAQRLGNRMENQVGPTIYNPNEPLPGDGGKNGYSLTSQEVLVPAFMAAYGNMSSRKVTLDRFPSALHMMPNWRLTFDGLSKIKFIQKYARTVSISHTYRATYNVGSYVSNPGYDLSDLESMRDFQSNFIPELDFSSVSIREQFSPLIGIDVTLKNSISTKFEIKKDRNVILSLANNQLTENMSYEYIIGAGYKISDFKLLVRSAGGQNSFSSDLNLRADFSLRNNTMIIRRLAEDDAQASQGQKVLTIKFSADYMLSDRFNLRMFYDRIVNTPFTSLSYATANSNFGFSLRFSLTQ